MVLSLAIKRLTLAVFLAVTCNFVWQVYLQVLDSIERERLYRETGWFVCTFGQPRDHLARFHIELFLILALIGSRSKGLKNTLPSVMGLTGAVISYILWWRVIFRITKNAEVSIVEINNFAYLVHGTIFDVAIAAAIGLLVLMNVCNAAQTFFGLNLNDERG
jgi:hypothetical protein